MSALFNKLHARLGDLWWYSLMIFVACRTGDVIQAFIGLWLVPRGWRYRDTVAYGHFGRDLFPWERTDRVNDILSALKESMMSHENNLHQAKRQRSWLPVGILTLDWACAIWLMADARSAHRLFVKGVA